MLLSFLMSKNVKQKNKVVINCCRGIDYRVPVLVDFNAEFCCSTTEFTYSSKCRRCFRCQKTNSWLWEKKEFISQCTSVLLVLSPQASTKLGEATKSYNCRLASFSYAGPSHWLQNHFNHIFTYPL